LLKGHSGHQVRVVVEKNSDQPGSNLLAQARKQMAAKRSLDPAYFIIPKVLETRSNGFTMEYIAGKNLFEQIRYGNPKYAVFLLTNFLTEAYQLCEQNESVAPWFNKLVGIKDHSRETLFAIGHFPRHAKVPCGFNHGDLSFSNMLFTDETLALIDWHPEELESPIGDILKLRLDAIHGWTLWQNGISESNAYREFTHNLLGQIEPMLLTRFTRNEVGALGILWLLRIYQHAKDDSVKKFLKEAMQKEYMLCQR
jgi:hypothetical protein